MTFWKALRWIGSIAFVALVVSIWLQGGSANLPRSDAHKLPPVPTIQ